MTEQWATILAMILGYILGTAFFTEVIMHTRWYARRRGWGQDYREEWKP